MLKSDRPFMCIGHRGTSGYSPENTLESFKLAIESGVSILECDARYTKDREVVVIHDHTVDRTTNGTGLVVEQTLSQLKCLDAGSWFGKQWAGAKIPTLLELLHLIDGKANLVIEIKDGIFFPSIIEKIVSIVEASNLVSSVNISAFHWSIIKRVKQLNPLLKTSALVMYDEHYSGGGHEVDGAEVKVYTNATDLIQDASASEADVVCPPAKAITQSMVKVIHEHGFLVRAWGIKGKDQAEMTRLIRCGVDGMTTDYPDVLEQIWNDVEKGS